jgi:hypothetical protein
MQNKHAKGKVEHEPRHYPLTELSEIATRFYVPACRSCDRHQDISVARSTPGGAIRVSEEVDSAAVARAKLTYR